MNKKLLNIGVQSFISNYSTTDILSVLLKKSPFDGVSPKELAQQITAKHKCKKKLPSWYTTSQIYYPNTLSIAQASSEVTAKYKSTLISGKSLVDVGGGFGVDSYYFSKRVDQVIHCEIDTELSQIAQHNFQILGATNINTQPINGIDYILRSEQQFDWLYIDPSRRNDNKGKVVKLEDCIPAVPLYLDDFFQKTNNIMLKSSPLLDISAGIAALKHVSELHIVAVNNEVKELLWILKKGSSGPLNIKTFNSTKEGRQTFHFSREAEKATSASIALPLTYLYEPNAAIMKSGGFKSIANKFDLKKLHYHTHLYTSEQLKKFPGRRFRVETTMAYNKKELRSIDLDKANIATRNFPETVATIRKKTKIKDGGATYLFFVTNKNEEHIILKCSKV